MSETAIELKKLTARHRGQDVVDVTHELRAGRHALLGRAEDGVSVLLACIAGEARPKRGSITVLGGPPAAQRGRVAFIPLGVKLADVLRVDETIAVARRIRKNAPVEASAVLAPLGLEALAKRRGDTLAASEARAVALAEALASPSVSVVLIEEPFVSMAASAVSALPAVLAARKNTCVVLSTASASDASILAEDFLVFDRGKLVAVTSDVRFLSGGAARETPRLRIVADDTRTLAAELAKKTEVTRLELASRSLLVEGDDALALATAVNAAIVDAHADVQSIDAEPASLEALRKPPAQPAPQTATPPTPQPRLP
jgi:ABC-type multidrug transport system ATPase subunit